MQKGIIHYRKEWKLWLEKRGYINCGHCPYHKWENWKRKPKPDRYKNIDRKTIRKESENAGGEF
jgi:hypothetical protein